MWILNYVFPSFRRISFFLSSTFINVYNLISSKLYINSISNIMKMQKKYELKGHFYSMERFCDIFPKFLTKLQPWFTFSRTSFFIVWHLNNKHWLIPNQKDDMMGLEWFYYKVLKLPLLNFERYCFKEPFFMFYFPKEIIINQLCIL